jgi:large subunit ribosomal protein L10
MESVILMNRTEKEAFVGDLGKSLSGAKAMVVAHYRGLTVKQLSALRRQMRAEGGQVQVAKNRLAKLAFKGTSFEQLNSLMVGPTILAYAADELAPSRVAQKFADANEAMVILGGMMDGKVLSKADVKTYASLPSLNELRGKIVGILQAPGAQLARVTKAYADKDQAAAA